MVKLRSDPKAVDILKDVNTTWSSRSETIWWAAYELIKTIRKEDTNPGETVLLKAEDAPIMNMEGFDLLQIDQEKFETWFAKWGYELYLPLLLKLPGLKEYSWYRFIDVGLTGLPDYYKTNRSVEYPPFLAILNFENTEAYENYETSIELAGFREAMKVPFPRGLDYKWYVQYQLMKSWRK
jgi:hypothetical protein